VTVSTRCNLGSAITRSVPRFQPPPGQWCEDRKVCHLILSASTQL
jgi:hypothetical protein